MKKGEEIKKKAYGIMSYESMTSEDYKRIVYKLSFSELEYKIKHRLEVFGFTNEEIKEVYDNVLEELKISEKAGYTEEHEGITCYYIDEEKVKEIVKDKYIIITKTIYLDIPEDKNADIDFKIVKKT